MINLYSIGFTKKTSEQFFNLLRDSRVKKLVDIRAHANSQLAGFAKASNLGYFSQKILGIPFEQKTEFAPSENLMQEWRKRKISYDEYRQRYISELNQRNVLSTLDFEAFNNACFLCSEPLPEPCHRKILCDYLKEHCPDDVIITHLV